jgi:hypothetical protein
LADDTRFSPLAQHVITKAEFHVRALLGPVLAGKQPLSEEQLGWLDEYVPVSPHPLYFAALCRGCCPSKIMSVPPLRLRRQSVIQGGHTHRTE